MNVTLPDLPTGHKWRLDYHNNLFAGPLCKIDIIKPTPKNILGFTFIHNKIIHTETTFADDDYMKDSITHLTSLVH